MFEIEYLNDLKKIPFDSYNFNSFHERYLHVNIYAWAIPTHEALEVIAKYGPIVEIGAGNGYWAYLLRKMGVAVRAFDNNHLSANEWFGLKPNAWTEIEPAFEDKAKDFPDHTLFLCWPPHDTEMATNTLSHYEGDYLVYVGEGFGGCNATNYFFHKLNQEWEVVERVSLPQWSGIHDNLTVYKRKV